MGGGGWGVERGGTQVFLAPVLYLPDAFLSLSCLVLLAYCGVLGTYKYYFHERGAERRELGPQFPRLENGSTLQLGFCNAHRQKKSKQGLRYDTKKAPAQTGAQSIREQTNIH